MVSIIIPVYNVEKYIISCAESILSQTLKDLEIIIVDDGSTDSSSELCDDIAKKDGRVKVYHKSNGGLMSAWKYGAQRATGDYIGFVDSDDWIGPDMFERMLYNAQQYDADIVTCGLVREFDDRKENETLFLAGGFYNRADIEEKIYPKLVNMGTMLDRLIAPSRVTKLFKSSILKDNMQYCDERVTVGEDFLTSFSCFCDAKGVYVMDDFFPYHYRMHGKSIMGSFNPNFTNLAILLNTDMRNVANEKNVFDFTKQLDNDLVSLIYHGFERNIMTCSKGMRYMISLMKDALSNECVRAALENETLYMTSNKCKTYKFLISHFPVVCLYIFIKYIVLLKRRIFGY